MGDFLQQLSDALTRLSEFADRMDGIESTLGDLSAAAAQLTDLSGRFDDFLAEIRALEGVLEELSRTIADAMSGMLTIAKVSLICSAAAFVCSAIALTAILILLISGKHK